MELPILPLQLEETLAKFAKREADEHDVACHQGMDIHHLKSIKVPALCFNSLFEMPGCVLDLFPLDYCFVVRFNSLFEMPRTRWDELVASFVDLVSILCLRCRRLGGAWCSFRSTSQVSILCLRCAMIVCAPDMTVEIATVSILCLRC